MFHIVLMEELRLCEGIGEKITQIKPFKDKILVLVKPPFGVSTKDVYQDFDLSKVIFHPRYRGT